MSEPMISVYREYPIKAEDLVQALMNLFDLFETDTGVRVIGVRCKRLDANDISDGLRSQRPIKEIELDME